MTTAREHEGDVAHVTGRDGGPESEPTGFSNAARPEGRFRIAFPRHAFDCTDVADLSMVPLLDTAAEIHERDDLDDESRPIRVIEGRSKPGMEPELAAAAAIFVARIKEVLAFQEVQELNPYTGEPADGDWDSWMRRHPNIERELSPFRERGFEEEEAPRSE